MFYKLFRLNFDPIYIIIIIDQGLVTGFGFIYLFDY